MIILLILRIVPRTTHRDYIRIYRGGGCSSLVGRKGGVQDLSLGNYCATNVGTPIHEFLHALGNVWNLSNIIKNI